MRHLTLIGIGTGHPDHLTRGAVQALQAAGTILIPRKGSSKEDLAEVRRALVDSVVTGPVRVVEFDLPVRDEAIADYRERVDRWHDAIAGVWTQAAGGADRVAMLVWGDPSLYDSTLRIAERLSPAPQIEVIPGITALQALTAAHAVTLNGVGEPVVITTGRQLRDHGWPPGTDRVAVMLDAGGAFHAIPAQGVTIWWGANLGLPSQALDHGPLAEAGPRILQTRAALRAAHGWVMDIYLLAREPAA
jgi:precorrin-6A synthase